MHGSIFVCIIKHDDVITPSCKQISETLNHSLINVTTIQNYNQDRKINAIFFKITKLDFPKRKEKNVQRVSVDYYQGEKTMHEN